MKTFRHKIQPLTKLFRYLFFLSQFYSILFISIVKYYYWNRINIGCSIFKSPESLSDYRLYESLINLLVNLFRTRKSLTSATELFPINNGYLYRPLHVVCAAYIHIALKWEGAAQFKYFNSNFGQLISSTLCIFMDFISIQEQASLNCRYLQISKDKNTSIWFIVVQIKPISR